MKVSGLNFFVFCQNKLLAAKLKFTVITVILFFALNLTQNNVHALVKQIYKVSEIL